MKKNNKGFSLVELIVVVLIMGIIGVALAPQVIKWVDNSRIAADAAAYDEMYEEIQVALVNRDAATAAKADTSGYVFTVSAADVKVAFGGKTYTVADAAAEAAITSKGAYGSGNPASVDPVIKALSDVDSEWSSFKRKATGTGTYVITVKSQSIEVVRSTAPTPETNY